MNGTLHNNGKLVTKLKNITITLGKTHFQNGALIGKDPDRISFIAESAIPTTNLLNSNYSVKLNSGKEYAITYPSTTNVNGHLSGSAVIQPSGNDEEVSLP